MKKIIRATERWPEYYLIDFNSDSKEPSVEITDELYQRWLTARAEFNKVQEELRRLIPVDKLSIF